MAVYAAHLTRTLHGTPSVFQIAAQEALGATVKPALRKVVEYLSTVCPRLGWAPRYFDELFLLLDAALQHHYLKHYAASFSESFYGLMRSPAAAAEFHAGARLPPALERGSLLLLVLAPYVRDRLAQRVEAWRRREEDGELRKSGADAWRRAAVRAHSALHFTWEALRLATLARHLAAGGGAPSPALWALGLVLREAPPPPPAPGCRDLLRSLARGDFLGARAALPLAGALLLRAAEHGAFLVHFLRWWDARAAPAAPPLPPPPPPPRDSRALRFKNTCPVCRRPWRAPAVLPVSGYVFCYACISRAVRLERRCPVTGAPAGDPAALVRVYVDT